MKTAFIIALLAIVCVWAYCIAYLACEILAGRVGFGLVYAFCLVASMTKLVVWLRGGVE